MNERGKSDNLVVPAKPPNNAGEPVAEVVEGRRLAEGNTDSSTRPGRSAGQGVPSGLDRVREVARRDKEARFTALLHHVDLDRLWAAYVAINPKAAPGADQVTWDAYGQDLRGNLEDLLRRVHSGAYRASPSRRVFPTFPTLVLVFDGCVGRVAPRLGSPRFTPSLRLVVSAIASVAGTAFAAVFLDGSVCAGSSQFGLPPVRCVAAASQRWVRAPGGAGPACLCARCCPPAAAVPPPGASTRRRARCGGVLEQRSRTASATVGSPMASCQLATGSWLVMMVDAQPGSVLDDLEQVGGLVSV